MVSLRIILQSDDAAVLNEAFMYSMTRLNEQGEISFGELEGANEMGPSHGCKYSTIGSAGNEIRCAAGWLMDDEELAKYGNVYNDVAGICDKMAEGAETWRPVETSIQLVSILQYMHDGCDDVHDEHGNTVSFRQAMAQGVESTRHRLTKLQITHQNIDAAIDMFKQPK